MAKIDNLQKTLNKLRVMIAKSRIEDNVRVSVGYSAPYAVHVHEDLQMHHKIGMAKFLEIPTRLLQPQLAVIIQNSMKSGKTLKESLTIAGTLLKKVSQNLVPVDTGYLRSSAFVRQSAPRGNRLNVTVGSII